MTDLAPRDVGADGVVSRLSLNERFVVPPFTVLDTRQGYWQDRRDLWKSLGIQSELGRAWDDSLEAAPQFVRGQATAAQMQQRYKAGGSAVAPEQANGFMGGTSIFDPVLCELAYRWFSAQGWSVLDPFAGGSVRGLVAGMLGRQYVGVDLSRRQVEANGAQADGLLDHLQVGPVWAVGDSTDLPSVLGPAEAYVPGFDFVLTCPPYYDLERYSDDPDDLSNAPDYDAFLYGYSRAWYHVYDYLADDRFACVVVGDIRDPKTGAYRGLVRDTLRAMEAPGFTYYNHAILVNSVGSLPIRSRLHFNSARKLGKCHQDVLVFVKGDAKRATDAMGEVDATTLLLPEPQLTLEGC